MPIDRQPLDPTMASAEIPGRFARKTDHDLCRRIHRQFGTTYYFATQRFQPQIRRRVHALYGFVRVPDEWVDNPNGLTIAQRASLLSDFRSQVIRGVDGVEPSHPVLRAFCDVMREVDMALDEPLCFLDAMEQDLQTTRYATYEELRGYMRGSASAVGLMMCNVLESPMTEEVINGAIALGEAMQLTNFLRDIGEDLRRGRIYIPLEDLEHFGVTEGMLLRGEISPAFVQMMKFQIERARHLYRVADRGTNDLPRGGRFAVRLARELYSRILGRIEANGYDVFSKRARTTKVEKIMVTISLWFKERS